MALVPSFFTGHRTNIFDPFSLDLWDPLEGFTFPTAAASSSSSTGRETSAVAHTRVDWKETADSHVFKADLPGLRKEEVRVEVEEGGRVLAIS
ncbi:17.6 kDa class I heat shock protein 3, partial [Striga hermonthica]